MDIITKLKKELEIERLKITDAQSNIRSLEKKLDEELKLLETQEKQKRFEQNQEKGRIWKENDPDGYNAFLENVKKRNRQGMTFESE